MQTQLSQKSEETSSSVYPSVAALAKEIKLSERSIRAAIKRGDIPHLRVGRRIILPRTAIADWLRSASVGRLER